MSEPPTSAPRRGWSPRVPAWVGALGRSGVPEALFAALVYLYNEVFPTLGSVRTATDHVLDFAICLFAAITGRWPRVGTVGVAASLLVMTATGYYSGAVFALFVPLVSNGAHGRRMMRDVGALTFGLLAIVSTLPDSFDLFESLQTVIVWAVLIGIGWATGGTIHRLRREGEQQAELRTRALRSQRRSIARDLHDTVSYATTTMIMRAEQIKLRSGDDPALVADLDFIIATGRRSIRDLRGMMETLRRNDPELDLDADAPWRLVTVGDVIGERRAELAAHGHRLDVQTSGDLDALPGSVRETLGKLIVEATSNMVKHAAPGPCRMIVEVSDDVLEAVFTNPLGSGTPQPSDTHLGLVGAAERVEAIGGELEATAASGTWILRAQIPLGE